MLRALITRPEQFFQKTAKHIKKTLPLYVILTVIYTVLLFIIELIFTKNNPTKILISTSVTLALFFVLLFVITALTYWFLKWCKVKGTYAQTFNVYVYVSVFVFIFTLVPMLIVNVLQGAVTGPTAVKVALLFFVLLITVFAMSTFMYSIIIYVLGQSVVHKLPYWKAFIASVLLPLLVGLLIIFVLFIGFITQHASVLQKPF